jgi:broad specificity phosphatase PhoE
MRVRVTGRTMRFIDAKQEFQPVQDDEWGPGNPEPLTDSEICRMSPEEYRSWRESGRRPKDEQPCNAERFARASDRMHGYRSAVTADETAGLSPAERFAQASARKWASYDPRGRVADLRRRRSE